METKAEMLLRKCTEQNEEFRKWDQQKDYSQFHFSHYDWWAFPVNRRSSYGNQFKVFPEHRYELIRNKQFIQALRSNSILVCKSWGYDLQEGKPCADLGKDQEWQNWSIRLYKMTSSLQLFQQRDLFKNAIKYGVSLIDQGDDFTYGPRDMKPYFRQNYTYLFPQSTKRKELLPSEEKEKKGEKQEKGQKQEKEEKEEKGEKEEKEEKEKKEEKEIIKIGDQSVRVEENSIEKMADLNILLPYQQSKVQKNDLLALDQKKGKKAQDQLAQIEQKSSYKLKNEIDLSLIPLNEDPKSQQKDLSSLNQKESRKTQNQTSQTEERLIQKRKNKIYSNILPDESSKAKDEKTQMEQNCNLSQ